MKIYDANGVAKDSASSSASSSSAGSALAAGTIDPLQLDVDGIALSQAIGAAQDDNGIALTQAPAAAVALTLEVAAASLIPARLITLTSAADLSAINFEIVGVDENGSNTNEIVVGPNANTVSSTLMFSSVTSITPDGTSGSNVEAGWPAITAELPLRLIDSSAIFMPTRRVSLTSASNLSSRSFHVEGVDENGDAQAEDITGPNANTVLGTIRYRSVSLVRPDDVNTNSVSVGWDVETTPLLIATEDLSLSHVFLSNPGPDPQNVELFLRIGVTLVSWKIILLYAYESQSLLAGDSAVPLADGDAIFASADEIGAVHFVIHGG